MKRHDSGELFRENMTLFLRNSPLIPPIPTKCEECSEFHIISDDLVYCVHCHYPIPGEKIQREPILPQVTRRSFLSYILPKR